MSLFFFQVVLVVSKLDVSIPRIAPRRFRLEEALAETNHAVVYLAAMPRLFKSDLMVAVKVFKDDYIRKQGAVSKFEEEVHLLHELNHPNIIKLLGYWDEETYAIYFPYIDGGNLKTYLDAKHNDTKTLLRLTYQLVEAIEYLHNQGYAHRDIKPDNILVTSQGQPYLIDLGFVTKCSTQGSLRGRVGSDIYMAPEVYHSSSYEPYRVDWWALGVTIYEIYLQEAPFKTDSKGNVDFQTDPFQGLPDNPLIQLIKQLLIQHPPQRLDDPQKIKSHSCFQTIQQTTHLDNHCIIS